MLPCSRSLLLAAAAAVTTTRSWRHGRRRRGLRHDLVMGSGSAPEEASFQAVLDGFKEQVPGRDVKYNPVGDRSSTVLSTAVQGGNPPDLAASRSPGRSRDFVEQGALQADRLRADDRRELRRVDRRARHRRRQALRRALQGGQQVDRLVQRPAFEDAGRRAAGDVGRFLEAPETLKASGVPAYSIGGADGWTLTDLFENIYIRTAGRRSTTSSPRTRSRGPTSR